MKKTPRDRTPRLKPVKQIELSEKNIKIRWILIAVLLIIALVAFGIGIHAFFSTEPGWQQVTVSEKAPNCSYDFVLMYDFTDYGGSASAVIRKITAMYTEQTQKAYQLFSTDDVETKLHNLYYLNNHLNETVQIDPVLYDALALIVEYNSRYPYLAPVYTEYDRIFISDNDLDASLYDPAYNPELAAYIAEAAAFANDPQMIQLQILGDNKVRLEVSREYLDFIEENGIETVFDFGWMRNAFVADYIADSLRAEGFTHGYIASYDGFTRNLDERGKPFSFNLFHRQGQDILIPAKIDYDRPMSIVFLRNYPMGESDRWHYYAYADGSIASTYLAPTDGKSKSATENMVAYSQNLGCAEVLLRMAPLYINDTMDMQMISALEQDQIYTIWYEGTNLHYNDPKLSPALLPVEQGYSYTLAPEK